MKHTLFKLVLLIPFIAFHDSAFSQRKAFLRHEFSVHTGYGKMTHRVAGLTLGSNDYRRSLSQGVNWEGQYHIFLARHVSMGLVYTGFYSGGSHAEGSDHLLIHYLAPQISIYMVNNDRWKSRLGIGLGTIFYRDNSEVFGKPRRVTGNAAGGHIGFSLARKLTRHWSAGMEVQYLFGHLSEVESRYHDETIRVEYNKSKPAMLNRLNISAGVSYSF